jgi:hypothetical protein
MMLFDSDEKIDNLVLVLNQKNLTTFKSCQGHNNSEWFWSFPWVAFLGYSDIDRIREILKEYNKKCIPEERWELCFSKKVFQGKPIYWLKPIHDYKNLEFLQNQIPKIVDYLGSC